MCIMLHEKTDGLMITLGLKDLLYIIKNGLMKPVIKKH